MFIQQISVFMGNAPGRLVEILRAFERHGIDLRAYSVAETSDFGIMRLIARDPDAAMEALKREGYTAKMTDALGIIVPDRPGSTIEAFRILGEAGINVEYTYAFAMAAAQSAFILLRVDDNETAARLLREAGIRLASNADVL